MKHSTPNSIKFLKLKRRLGLAHWQVVGLLESLWLFTQVNTPHGDIGRHSNEDIAAAIEYDGDPDELIRHLVECRWLDKSDQHRIVVHDWHQHAPNYIKGSVASSGGQFATQPANAEPADEGQNPVESGQTSPPAKQGGLAGGLGVGLSRGAKPVGQAPPQPNLTKPNQTSKSGEGEASPVLIFETTDHPPGGSAVWNLTAYRLSQWQAQYPNLDVLAECEKARDWLASNGRKTQREMNRFLDNWLLRATRPPTNRPTRPDATGPPARSLPGVADADVPAVVTIRAKLRRQDYTRDEAIVALRKINPNYPEGVLDA